MKQSFTFLFLLVFFIHSSAQSSFKVVKVNQSLFGGNIINAGPDKYGFTSQAASSNNVGSILVEKLNQSLTPVWSSFFTDSIHDFQDIFQQHIVACRNGGFALAVHSVDVSDGSLYILKTDSLGNLLWSKKYNMNNASSINNIAEAYDGSLLVAGSVLPTGTPGENSNTSVLRVNGSNGNLLWLKTIAFPGYSSAGSIALTKDSGFIVCGVGAFGPSYTFEAKYNSRGNLEWKRVQQSPDQGEIGLYNIIQTFDGGYLYTGSIYTGLPEKGYDLSAVKLTASGDVAWAKVLGGSGEDGGTNIVQNADSTYTIGGLYGSQNEYIVKLSQTGSSIWQTVLNPAGLSANTVISDNHGGYIASGRYSTLTILVKNYSFLAKVTGSGSNCAGVSVNEAISDLPISRIGVKAQPGDLTSQVVVEAGNFKKTSLTLTYSLTCSDTGVNASSELASPIVANLKNAKMEAAISPNPVYGSMRLMLSSAAPSTWQVSVTDIYGKTVFTQQYTDVQQLSKTIDVSRWAAGMYIVKATTGNWQQTIKVVKAK